MIWKWVQELISKYSYITKVTMHNHYIFFHYIDLAGNPKSRRIPFRATKQKVITLLNEIKEEIEYKTVKKNYKLAGFAFTNPDEQGEDNE